MRGFFERMSGGPFSLVIQDLLQKMCLVCGYCSVYRNPQHIGLFSIFLRIRKKPGGTHFFHTENEFLKRCEIAVGSMVSRARQLVAIAAAVRDILRGWPSTMWRSGQRCAASMADACDWAAA